MGAKFSLDGAMIPRTVKRMFDERAEERLGAGSESAMLVHRGEEHVVRLVNLSASGAMVIYSAMPHIGEEVTLQLPGRDVMAGHVMWVRDGRIGVQFAGTLE